MKDTLYHYMRKDVKLECFVCVDYHTCCYPDWLKL